MDKEKFYITTPIYYPSANFHIGHCYCTVAADSIARYKRERGFDVRFLTGTDEHGQKIQRKAEAEGVTPKEYVDKIVENAKELWKSLDISYDDFIRTTDERHVKTVQKIFKKLYDHGDIYKSEYEGLYCTPCESFWTQTQAQDGKCPDCGRDLELVKEESYFLKLSKYQDRLLEYIESHDEFMKPGIRKNEMINNFIKPGLQDLCVSRTTFDWGIPVTFDEKHVVNVWADALSNYISALGCYSENDELFKKYWPADLHLVGKEIFRFHTIIWPIMLMALDIPLPKQVFGHGWLVINGSKISKSLGNYADPRDYINKYGLDAVRYYLLHEVQFGQDGNFSEELLATKSNSDLANDLGNLVSRTVAMVEKYFAGTIPSSKEDDEYSINLKQTIKDSISNLEQKMDALDISNALNCLWEIIRRTNKYIDEEMPWAIAKDESQKEKLKMVMYNLIESIRIISVLLKPFLPATSKKIWEQIGIQEGAITTWESSKEFGLIQVGTKVQKGQNLFDRIDLSIFKEEAPKEKKLEKKKENNKNEDNKEQEKIGLISIDEFSKISLKAAKVLEVEKVEGADKLLKIQIDLGSEKRTIVSGIAKYYSKEDLIGKNIVVCTNLKPVKLRGIESNGMLLAAGEDPNVKLLMLDDSILPGTSIH